jgi:quercetin dioxygenase-like cupin family protein
VFQRHVSVPVAGDPGMNAHKPAELVRTWFDTGNLRVAEFRLEPGASGEAHWHTCVDELCICLEGGLIVRRRGCPPRALDPGQYVEVPAGEIHRVSAAAQCESRYLVVQGIGRYDFVVE